jgi:hypothetical protein
MLLPAADKRGPMVFAGIAMRQALQHEELTPAKAPLKKRAKKYRIVK